MSPRALLVIASVLWAASAIASDPTEALNAERDALLVKIANGVDAEASTRRFAALLKQRDAVTPTTFAAREAARLVREAEQAYEKTLDAQIASRCALSPDPAHPRHGRQHTPADWGRVVRKQEATTAPRNVLDPPQPYTLYEVKGLAGTYVFRSEHFGLRDRPFSAAVGDLVMVCTTGSDLSRDLPDGWGDSENKHGVAAKISRPPLVVDKARFDATYVTEAEYRSAIERATWAWPGQRALSHLQLGARIDRGQPGTQAGPQGEPHGETERYEIPVFGGKSIAVDVPPHLSRRALIVPGRTVWLILERPRFDPAVKRLILDVVDVEAAYVFE